MAKRRTKEDVAFNEKLLDRLFQENRVDERGAEVYYKDLVNGGYKGSMPYTTPNSVGEKYMIKQNKKTRGESLFATTYSIFKLK